MKLKRVAKILGIVSLVILATILTGALALQNDWMFERAANAWRVPSDPLPTILEAVVTTSYGAFEDKLVDENRRHIEKAVQISQIRPEAIVGYSAFTHSVDTGFEEAEKRRMLEGRRTVFAGNVASTIEEAEAYHRVLLTKFGREPKSLVVVSGEFHGRSARHVYQKTFPHTHIALALTPWQGEAGDPNDLQTLSRTKQRWLLANVARQALIAWVPFDLGYWAYKKLGVRQPTW